MTTPLISPWDYKTFDRTRKKLIEFKQRTGFSNEMIGEKCGFKIGAMQMLLNGNREPLPTERQYDKMKMIIEAYHLNPRWIAGKSKKMFLDFEALSEAEIEKVKRNKRR